MKVKKEYFVEALEEANLITEAFGIDSGYCQKICDLDIPDNYDILFITGESGSGKTTILKEIINNYKQSEIPIEKPLFLWCGETEEDKIRAINLLTLVGISDATMFVNYYNNLSDSQQARSRIMLEIISGKETIVIDEFLATLDRETAKAVSYSIQKAIRKLGKKAIFVTANDDIEDYLQPSHVIKGTSFPSKFEVYEYTKRQNLIKDNTIIRYGDKLDYKNLGLGELHYKGKYTGGAKEYLFAEYNNRIIGVLVSIYRMHDGGRRISRVVVHPSYRGIGIGAKIINRYITDFENVDVVASMALYNPVFEKAGMVKTKDSIVKPPTGLKKELKENGFDCNKWYSKKYCEMFSESGENRKIIAKYSKFAGYFVCPAGKYLPINEIENKIISEVQTCARVIYGLRERTMAKYITKDS